MERFDDYSHQEGFYNFPARTETLSSSGSTDNRVMESHTDSDSDLPSIRSLLQKPYKERGDTDVTTVRGSRQQKEWRIHKQAGYPLQDKDGSESAVSFGDQDRLEDMATSTKQGSVEIPESPCRDSNLDGLHAPRTAIVTAGPQHQGGTDSTTEHDRQVCDSNGLFSSSHMSQGQAGGEGRSRDVSQMAEESPRSRSITDNEIWGSASDTSCLGVFGQRETSRGLEYRCLVGTWLRPDDDIAKKQIRQYHRRLVVQSSRRQSLRKRKHKSTPANTDQQWLRKIKRWKNTKVLIPQTHQS